jgi:hypothetical protein
MDITSGTDFVRETITTRGLFYTHPDSYALDFTALGISISKYPTSMMKLWFYTS